MDAKHEDKTIQPASGEAERYRASARAHLRELKEFWIIFIITSVVIIAVLVVAIRGGFSWFVSNSKVYGSGMDITYAGQSDFALATVGNMEQGVYDSLFDLSSASTKETYGGTDYYIASANSSFRVSSDKSFNNYLDNADLRPGNRGTFELYVICYSEQRNLVLQPAFSAWYETGSVDVPYKNACVEVDSADKHAAAEFVKGHILLFANMDEKGMYSGSIDYTKKIQVNLSTQRATQSGVTGADRSYSWGKLVYSDENTSIYCLTVYWVWPEQFGNFIYTGNSYNKNLFKAKGPDYEEYLALMQNDTEYKRFFSVEASTLRPPIASITNPETEYQEATKYYELYSEWYNRADELIGEMISYIELGFELSQTAG